MEGGCDLLDSEHVYWGGGGKSIQRPRRYVCSISGILVHVLQLLYSMV